MDVPVSSTEWQEGEKSMRVIERVIRNAGGFVDAAPVVEHISGG